MGRIALVLDDEDRAALDREIAPRLPELSTRAAVAAARRVADRLDQQAALRRLAGNEAQRCVSIRAAADGMVRLSALLPTRDGIAVYAALKHAADTAHVRSTPSGESGIAGDGTGADGTANAADRRTAVPAGTGPTASVPADYDAPARPRSRGQIMADTLVERVIGSPHAGAVPIEIQLLMTDRSLCAGGTDPGVMDGIDVPAPITRRLALGAAASEHAQELEAERFLRRLYADPVSGEVTDYDTRRRSFTGAVRGFILARDQRCRVPYCDAPIRHIDHVHRFAEGGRTRLDNGVGLCTRHNLNREQPGWSVSTGGKSQPDGRLVLRTPAGRSYHSDPPDLHHLVGRPLGIRRTEAPDLPRTTAPDLLRSDPAGEQAAVPRPQHLPRRRERSARGGESAGPVADEDAA